MSVADESHRIYWITVVFLVVTDLRPRVEGAFGRVSVRSPALLARDPFDDGLPDKGSDEGTGGKGSGAAALRDEICTRSCKAFRKSDISVRSSASRTSRSFGAGRDNGWPAIAHRSSCVVVRLAFAACVAR